MPAIFYQWDLWLYVLQQVCKDTSAHQRGVRVDRRNPDTKTRRSIVSGHQTPSSGDTSLAATSSHRVVLFQEGVENMVDHGVCQLCEPMVKTRFHVEQDCRVFVPDDGVLSPPAEYYGLSKFHQHMILCEFVQIALVIRYRECYAILGVPVRHPRWLRTPALDADGIKQYALRVGLSEYAVRKNTSKYVQDRQRLIGSEEMQRVAVVLSNKTQDSEYLITRVSAHAAASETKDSPRASTRT
jgi:hypothetical protein